jgi:Tfp pilus assembly protein PilZ
VATGQERRRSERIDINDAFATLADGTYVSNLSEHGVFVHSPELFPIGTEIDLRFTVLLDDPVVVAARGRVVRHQTDPQGMGIEFTNLAPEAILRINDALRSQRPQKAPAPVMGSNAKKIELSGDPVPARDVKLEATDADSSASRSSRSQSSMKPLGDS